LGGAAYHAALHIERGPHRFLRRTWATAIAALAVGGIWTTAAASLTAGNLVEPVASLRWLFAGAAFAVGLLVVDRLGERWERRAALALDDHERSTSGE
jgi:hypothetical protein